MRLSFTSLVHMVLLSGFVTSGLKAQDTNTPYSYHIRKKVDVTHGAVVSAHPLASSAGVSVLKQGGNAFDAAIATQLALAVVYPAAGNIGGGGFMVAHTAKGKNIALDYREKAPAAATRDMYLDEAGNPRPGLSENATSHPAYPERSPAFLPG